MWILRFGWVALPFVAGPVLANALNERTTTLRTTASIELWIAWALVVGALLIPSTISLVIIRVIALGAPVISAAAVINTSAYPLALGVTAAVALVAFTPQIGELEVNAGSYGDEERFLLRAPGSLYLGPLPLAWFLLTLSVVTGPLLIADRQWLLGGLAVGIGLPIAVILARAFHSLCQRWIVFVPAGVVLKDHNAVVDPVLFRRSEIEILHPAPANTDSLDLTSHAPGIALELRLKEKIPLVRAMPGRQPGQPGKSSRLLFTPTRPGGVLVAAGKHRIPLEDHVRG